MFVIYHQSAPFYGIQYATRIYVWQKARNTRIHISAVNNIQQKDGSQNHHENAISGCPQCDLKEQMREYMMEQPHKNKYTLKNAINSIFI